MLPTLIEPVNVREYEALARAILPAGAFDNVAGGANDEITLLDNVAAFERWRLVPRVLVDIAQVDTHTTVLGKRLTTPVLLAPVGFQGLLHPDAEVASARAAETHDTVLTLSTLCDRSIEEVRAAAPSATLWQQLYLARDRVLTRDLVERARAADCAAIVVTVDTPMNGRRERSLRNGFSMPEHLGLGLLRHARVALSPSDRFALFALGDHSPTWDDLSWLKSVSRSPVVIKGILSADDARLAVEHGADAIVVSNHGGRQLDRAPASLDVLREIVDAVGPRAEVLLDGGVRRGIDALVAIALGARAVMVGRPLAWSLAVGGQAGVEHMLSLFHSEIELGLRLSGRRSLADIGADLLRPALARP